MKNWVRVAYGPIVGDMFRNFFHVHVRNFNHIQRSLKVKTINYPRITENESCPMRCSERRLKGYFKEKL